MTVGGKKTLFLLLAGLAFTTGLLFYSFGADAWQLWNIPAMSPSFADTRSILAGGEEKRLGNCHLYEKPRE